MTDRISTDELRHAAPARRFYLHVLNGGTLREGDVSLMVQTIEELESEVIRLREALEKIADHHTGSVKDKETARAALNHKET